MLSLLLEHLHRDEVLSIVLVNTTFITLKSAPGPINPQFPHFDLHRNGGKIAELWTDIEFLSLSHSVNSVTRPPNAGEYHELDIVVIDPGVSGRPRNDQVWLGVECKNTNYKKSLLKEILGIRRELSFLAAPQSTRFLHWPRSTVLANPPSCLLVYSTDSAISNYSSPGTLFGIDFFHEAI